MTSANLEEIGNASFLDRRMSNGISLDMLNAAEAGIPLSSPPAFLFHTAFCGSTLLARALHAPPRTVALKEPQILLSLAMAARPKTQSELLWSRLQSAVALLARPWADGGRVLLKPTNQCNNLLGTLLQISPQSRAILLYSGLEEFLLSCFKKLPEAETRIRWMAQHLIAGTRLATKLEIAPDQRFNVVESSVLTWFAQMEIYADALANDTGDRLRTLGLSPLLADPLRCVSKCTDWLELDDGGNLTKRVTDVFSRDSKFSARQYDTHQREAEKLQVKAMFGGLIHQAYDWALARVAPAAVLPMDWKPLSLD